MNYRERPVMEIVAELMAMEKICVAELRQSPNKAHADAVQKIYERIGALRTSMTPSDSGMVNLMPRPVREQVNIPYSPPKQTGPKLGGFIAFPWLPRRR